MTLWTLLLIVAMFTFMIFWTWLLMRSGGLILFFTTTIGLSLGAASLLALGNGMLGGSLQWRVVEILEGALCWLGFIVMWFSGGKRSEIASSPTEARIKFSRIDWFIVAIICGLAALIIFNATYWPIGIDDAVTIYAWWGKQIALTAQLPRGNLYEAYPMLVPLSYAQIYYILGAVNDYVAAIVPAVLSIGVIGVSYVLGRELYNYRIGLIAALLVALAPMITHWASTGYVDLPTAFFYGLSAVYIVRLRRDPSWQNALLGGIIGGLAAWTKISGLLIIPAIGLWIGYLWLRREALSLRHIAFIVGGFLIAAAPWYARNVLVDGVLIPATGWTWLAERTVINLFPYLADTRYWLIGVAFTAGLLFILWRTWRTRGKDEKLIFLLIFYIPFFAIWWALFSYDGRFLLVLTPIIAVMGAALVAELAARIPVSVPYRALAVGAVVVILAIPAANAAVDYKTELIHHPVMTDADKERLRFGKTYDMGLYLQTLAPGSRVWTPDLFLPYEADGVQVIVGGTPTPDTVTMYDYLAVPPNFTLPAWISHYPLVHSEGDYRLYSTHLTG